jgi:hypothetical protein
MCGVGNLARAAAGESRRTPFGDERHTINYMQLVDRAYQQSLLANPGVPTWVPYLDSSAN